MIQKLKSIQQTVKRILEIHPATRDNDRLLMIKVWAVQNPKIKSYNTYLLVTWAKDFIKGEYADPESIRRTRQKLQENNANLRGESYYRRKDLQDDTRKEITLW